MGAADVEANLGALVRAGDLERAATQAVESYGAELYGFLINIMGAEADAAEVFSQTVEDMWRGLPSFGARCSMRTWLYVLAKNAASRYWRTPWNRGQRTGDSKLEAFVEATRSRTNPWQRTDVKDKWRELRESLAAEDRALLVLRVDRDLSWTDVARVMLESDEVDASALDREAARLRKRFQSLKDELRKRARAAGMIG